MFEVILERGEQDFFKKFTTKWERLAKDINVDLENLE
jgi:hypothetical protein